MLTGSTQRRRDVSVLLLKISPPLQSWGVASKFYQTRSTSRAPSKSGVIGMICAAFGWPRTHDLSRLRAVRMGVRIDEPGRLEMDYHTAASHPERDGGAKGLSTTKVTKRWYLTDAAFVVGLESGDEAFLGEIRDALMRPRWCLYAGRKSCPVNHDLVMGIVDSTLEEALAPGNTPLIVLTDGARKPSANARRVEALIESNDGYDLITVEDEPLSFDPSNRRFASRTVKRTWYERGETARPSMSTWVEETSSPAEPEEAPSEATWVDEAFMPTVAGTGE